MKETKEQKEIKLLKTKIEILELKLKINDLEGKLPVSYYIDNGGIEIAK